SGIHPVIPRSLHDALPISGHVCIAAAHHEDSHRGLAVNAIVNPFKPVVEPSNVESSEIQRSLRSEFSFAGMARLLAAVQSSHAGDRKSTRLNSSHRTISYA